MKSVIKILKLFCGKLVNFSELANEMVEMTEGLRSLNEGGITNFSLRSRVKIRQFSQLMNDMKTALEDFAVWSDDMRRACPKENERLGRKLRMTCKCFSELQDDFKKIQDDVQDAVELASKDGEMSKSAPSNPAESDLQAEDTGMAHKMESTVNGAMPEGTKGDANISGPAESVNNNFSKDEYLKSLFTRIADQFDNFSDKLNDAGDLVEEVTDDVVMLESPELLETCSECGKNPCECEENEELEEEIKDSVLDKPDPEELDPEEKTDLVKTEDEVTGEATEPEEGDVSEFCSRNFSESVAQDKTVAPEVHESLKVLTDTADAIKSGSLEDVNKAFDKLDDLEKKDKNFAAITACALMCFSEICKECGQVIPGTEDKVETSAEDVTDKVETPEGEVETEETEETKSDNTDDKVSDAIDTAEEEDEVEPPTDEEIIMNFSLDLTTIMDGEFLDAPNKAEGENEAKPDAGDAPSKREGQAEMTDVAPVHPDVVKLAMFSVIDKCDEFLDKKAKFADVVEAANFAKKVMSTAYSTPEECLKYSTKFANFCGEMGLFKATESADDSTAVEAAKTTVDPIEEGNTKLNKLVETLKGKLENLDLDPTMKSFATKLCEEFSSTKCFSEDDLNIKMSKIDNFAEELKNISGIEDAGTITEGENAEDAKVSSEVENAVDKNDAAQDAETAKLESEMAPATDAPNTPEETPSDALVVTTNFSQKTQSGSYGSRMLSILGIR